MNIELKSLSLYSTFSTLCFLGGREMSYAKRSPFPTSTSPYTVHNEEEKGKGVWWWNGGRAWLETEL